MKYKRGKITGYCVHKILHEFNSIWLKSRRYPSIITSTIPQQWHQQLRTYPILNIDQNKNTTTITKKKKTIESPTHTNTQSDAYIRESVRRNFLQYSPFQNGRWWPIYAGWWWWCWWWKSRRILFCRNRSWRWSISSWSRLWWRWGAWGTIRAAWNVSFAR